MELLSVVLRYPRSREALEAVNAFFNIAPAQADAGALA
jgi:hypothetical protein